MAKSTILVAKQNADGSETIISRGHSNDQEAIKSISEPGDYIFYEVKSLSKEDLKTKE